jgi:hypothetical protein
MASIYDSGVCVYEFTMIGERVSRPAELERHHAPRGGMFACKVDAVGAHLQGGGASRPWLRRWRAVNCP